MTTPALRVNGLQIVAHDAPASPGGLGPFSGIEIRALNEAPPHSNMGGVLWSDGDALHWSTPAGRDVELPRVTSSQLLVVDDLDHAFHAQENAAFLGGAVGGLFVLFAMVLAQRIGRWRAQVRWERSQPRPQPTPYRGDKS